MAKIETIDVELIKKLLEQSGCNVYKTEIEVGISRNYLRNGLNPNNPVRVSKKWEAPLVKYLKKKIALNKEAELHIEEIKLEAGLEVPEKQSNLKEELKEKKRNWIIKLNEIKIIN